MTYNELLIQKEWWEKCNEILSRDKFICQDCKCLGYHNDSSFIELSSFEELDSILKDWRINNLLVSDFIRQEVRLKPYIFNYSLKDLDLHEEKCVDNIYVYSILLLGKAGYDILTCPGGIKPICNFKQEKTNAKLIIRNTGNVVSNIKNEKAGGGFLFFKFENQLTKTIYLNIEYHLVGTIGYGYERQYIENTTVNITFENYLLSIIITPVFSGIKGLNIHHKYYIEGKKPWEYSNNALITLCEDCHKKRHQETDIPLYKSDKTLIANLKECDRCDGSGYLPQYSHVENGTCFKCGGEGVVLE